MAIAQEGVSILDRVRVEHRIANLKSFRILFEGYGYPKATYAAKLAIIAGIIKITAGS